MYVNTYGVTTELPKEAESVATNATATAATTAPDESQQNAIAMAFPEPPKQSTSENITKDDDWLTRMESQ